MLGARHSRSSATLPPAASPVAHGRWTPALKSLAHGQLRERAKLGGARLAAPAARPCLAGHLATPCLRGYGHRQSPPLQLPTIGRVHNHPSSGCCFLCFMSPSPSHLKLVDALCCLHSTTSCLSIAVPGLPTLCCGYGSFFS